MRKNISSSSVNTSESSVPTPGWDLNLKRTQMHAQLMYIFLHYSQKPGRALTGSADGMPPDSSSLEFWKRCLLFYLLSLWHTNTNWSYFQLRWFLGRWETIHRSVQSHGHGNVQTPASATPFLPAPLNTFRKFSSNNVRRIRHSHGNLIELFP